MAVLWNRANQSAGIAREHAVALKCQLYVQNLYLAQHEWQSNNVALAESLLEQCPSYLRGWEWSYLKNQCHLDLLTVRGHTTSPGAVRWGLSGIYGLNFSPDGKQIASAGSDNLVKVWDVSTGREIRTLKGHTDVVFAVSFSPDGQMVATGSKDATIKLWDARTGALVRTLEGHTSWVRNLAFSPDGTQIVSGSGGWSLSSNEGKTPELILWDVNTGTPTRKFLGHSAFIRDVAFRPDGKEIASVSYDRTARLWNTSTGEPGHVLPHDKYLCSVAYSPDGSQIVTSGQDALVSVWDTVSGRLIRSFQGHAGSADDAMFSPDGTQIAVAASDQTVRLWDVATVTEVATIRGHVSPINAVRFSPTGQEIATASEDDTVKLWNATTSSGGEARTLIRIPSGLWAGRVTYSRDGKQIGSLHREGYARLWDDATESQLNILNSSGNALDISPNGRTIATDLQTTIKLYDAENGNIARTLIGHPSNVIGLYFSPDGRSLASIGADDDIIRFWDVATAREVKTISCQKHLPFQLAFHPDGLIIASVGWDSTVRLWNVATGQLLRTHRDVLQVRSDKSGNALDFSPDGRQLAASSDDKTVKIWDVASGEQILTLRGHTKEVHAVAYLDETRIVSGSEDATIKIRMQKWATISSHFADIEKAY